VAQRISYRIMSIMQSITLLGKHILNLLIIQFDFGLQMIL
jgi:hypothetical protein